MPVMPELTEEMIDSFTDTMIQLEKTSPGTFRSCLGKIAVFIQQTQPGLIHNIDLPDSFTTIASFKPDQKKLYRRIMNQLLVSKLVIKRSIVIPTGSSSLEYAALKKAVPVYRESMKYIEKLFRHYGAETNIASRIVRHLNDAGSLYVAYRLWNPGLLTIGELAEFTGQNIKEAFDTTKKLAKLHVIERKLRGIYIPGPNAQLAMNVFALMTLLWRETTDGYLELPVDILARPVRYFVESQETVIELVDELPDLESIPSAEPIVVTNPGMRSKESKFSGYITSFYLWRALNLGLDSYLDNPRRRMELPSANVEDYLQEMHIVENNLSIKQALCSLPPRADAFFFHEGENLRYCWLGGL